MPTDQYAGRLAAARVLELRNRLSKVPDARRHQMMQDGVRLGEEDIRMRLQAKVRRALTR